MPDTSFDYEAALQACARGEQQALHDIYVQDGRHLLGVAMRIVRERHLAEDILHEAFVSIWHKAGSFDAVRGSGRGWIYSIVRHQALNTMRNRERDVSADEEVIEALDARHADEMPDLLAAYANKDRLHDCLSALDPPKRDSLLHAYVDGCSHREVAERMQSPVGTVKAWIRRGLLALKECMG